jgi:hypothetical protein
VAERHPNHTPPPDPVADPVADGLRELGRALVVTDPPADLAAAVLARVAAEPVPRPARWRRVRDRVVVHAGRARRVVVVVVAAALLTLVVVTPAGARVAEWLGLGAVVVVQTPRPPGGSTAPVPDGAGDPGAGAVEVSLDDARARVPFPLGVPAALGDPDRVQITADGRVVTMTWSARPELRLDQLAGEPSPYYLKRYHGEMQNVVVAGGPALWLPGPHSLEYVDPTGADQLEPARTAGPSLVWQRGGVTLRLEGEPDLTAALAVAESVG